MDILNFLTHYYFNRMYLPELAGESAYHFGAALPDMLSAYDRSLRFSKNHVVRHLARSAQPRLWAGVLNHILIDGFFHQSVFFRSLNEEIRQRLVTALPPNIDARRFFLSHIFVELLLDHHLLRREPSLADEFYEVLGYHPEAKDEMEAFFHRELVNMDAHFERFRQLRFLTAYDEIEKLAHPVNRMLIRTRQNAFPSEENERLIGLLHHSYRLVAGHFDQLVGEVSEFYENYGRSDTPL